MSAEVAEWFGTWWVIWSPILLLLLAGASTGIWAIITRRDGERIARKSPLPPTWPEMWARIDAQDMRIEALENLLGESKQEVQELVAEGNRKDNQMDELIQHILRLELLVPTPPGPPARPKFITVT